jgi:hypothetical protein
MLELLARNPREFVKHNAPSTENRLLFISGDYHSFKRILFAAIGCQAQPLTRIHQPGWIDRLERNIPFKRAAIKRLLRRRLYPV